MVTVLFTSCSSLPDKGKPAPVNGRKEQAVLYLDRGHTEYNWGNYESSVNFYSQSFELASSVDWQEGMVRSLIHLSRSYDRIGQGEAALARLAAAEELLERYEDPLLDLLTGNRRTEWLLFNKDVSDALEHGLLMTDRAGSIKARESGESWRVLAAVYKRAGELDDSLDAIEQAVSIDSSRNYTAELASDYYIRSSVLSLSGRESEAVESMFLALEKDKFIENTASIAQDLYALALIYEKTGDLEEAAHFLNRSYLVYLSSDSVEIPAAVLEMMESYSGSSQLGGFSGN